MIDVTQFISSLFDLPELSVFKPIFAGVIVLVTISCFLQFFLGAFTSMFK